MKAKEKVKDIINMYLLSIIEKDEITVGKTDLVIRLQYINYLVLNYTNTNEIVDVIKVYKDFAKKVLGVNV